VLWPLKMGLTSQLHSISDKHLDEKKILYWTALKLFPSSSGLRVDITPQVCQGSFLSQHNASFLLAEIKIISSSSELQRTVLRRIKHKMLRFQFLMAASMKMTVFWDVISRSLIEVYLHFRSNRHLLKSGKPLPDYRTQQPGRPKGY
jgi:hypothetical protein